MEITFQNGCSPVILILLYNLTPFPKNTTRRMLLYVLSFLLVKSFCKKARLAQVLVNSSKSVIHS